MVHFEAAPSCIEVKQRSVGYRLYQHFPLAVAFAALAADIVFIL